MATETMSEEIPLGDVVFQWALMKIGEVLMELRDMINSHGFKLLHTYIDEETLETLSEDLEQFLKESDEQNGTE